MRLRGPRIPEGDPLFRANVARSPGARKAAVLQVAPSVCLTVCPVWRGTAATIPGIPVISRTVKTTPEDPFELQRFVDAQQGSYPQARAELAAGDKRSHWMWFIFPQIAGLGFSSMAQRYAISGLDEAGAYLAHPLLGPRLRECTALVNAVQGRPLGQIFGSPDDMKFHSSMTLFARATEDSSSEFHAALKKYFAGKEDAATVSRLPS